MAEKTTFGFKAIFSKMKKNVLPTKIGFKCAALTKENLEPLKDFMFDSVEILDSDIDALSSLPPSKFYSFNACQIFDFDKLRLEDPWERRVEFFRCLSTIPNMKFMPKSYHFFAEVDTPMLSVEGIENQTILFHPFLNKGKKLQYTWCNNFILAGVNKRLLLSMLKYLPEDIRYEFNNQRYTEIKKEDWNNNNPLYYADRDGTIRNHLDICRAYGNNRYIKSIDSKWLEIANSGIGDRVLGDV